MVARFGSDHLLDMNVDSLALDGFLGDCCRTTVSAVACCSKLVRAFLAGDAPEGYLEGSLILQECLLCLLVIIAWS